MKMDWVPGRNGYDIPVRAAWAGEEQVVIICHGFGSSKASPMVEALMQTLPQHGITAVAFDFPAHGDSPVDGAYLRVPYCIDDLETVEAWVRTILPKASVGYFGSSCGAYITLLRLGRQGVSAFGGCDHAQAGQHLAGPAGQGKLVRTGLLCPRL